MSRRDEDTETLIEALGLRHVCHTDDLPALESAIAAYGLAAEQRALREAAEALAIKAGDDSDLVSVGQRTAATWLKLRADALHPEDQRTATERKPCAEYLDAWKVGNEWLAIPSGAVCPRCGFTKEEHPAEDQRTKTE